jgi:ABC-type transport system involved in multi-copper enzyme maturation permease subunit
VTEPLANPTSGSARVAGYDVGTGAKLFTAIFSAASIVWDREFGFLREMLVAPVSRSAIVIGKCLGGATVSTVQ